MQKAVVYLLTEIDDPVLVAGAVQLILDDQAEQMRRLNHMNARLEDALRAAIKDRDIYKSQFEQATGIEVPE